MGRPWVCQVGGATIVYVCGFTHARQLQVVQEHIVQSYGCGYACVSIDHEWVWFYQANTRDPLDRDRS